MEFTDKYGHPDWNVRFREGAPHTVGFGLDDTFRNRGRYVRIHAANDRGTQCSDGECRDIYSPFDVKSVDFRPWGGGFGSLLFLNVENDFEIRIAHMSFEDLSGPVKKALSAGTGLHAGDYVGRAGNEGISVGGHHTHTEVVSIGKRSQILDWLCHYWGKVYDIDPTHDIGTKDVMSWAQERRLPIEDTVDMYSDERRRRGVILLNRLRCVRMDYKTGYREKRTFYDSWTLFNGV